jgi:hypothetical protein
VDPLLFSGLGNGRVTLRGAAIFDKTFSRDISSSFVAANTISKGDARCVECSERIVTPVAQGPRLYTQ